jgi:hypothetical protein
MTHPEALLSGPSAALTVIERPAVRGVPAAYGRRELSPAQIRWLEATHRGISRNKFQPLERK